MLENTGSNRRDWLPPRIKYDVMGTCLAVADHDVVKATQLYNEMPLSELYDWYSTKLTYTIPDKKK